ncbi:MAG TPA: serine/threonine-protein kinase [Caulobacteraceae bacterium]
MAPPDDDKKAPDEARTVFMPAVAPPAPSAPVDTAAEDDWFSGAAEEPAPAAAPPPPEPARPPATWSDVPAGPAPAPPAPDWSAPAAPPPEWGAAASAPPAAPQPGDWGAAPPVEPSAPPPPPPRATVEGPPPGPGGRLAIGSLLNHIYEVRRFIARGGMGEVYEGVNVNTDERVAIKVILSHLAEDPNVLAMFRKEARTLTRLSHPGLVQYRVLAQEPSLRALYIVTEYIDGPPLGDVIGQIHPSATELEGLTRRLAAGLNAAHELGAIHRDMSPDNVLLPGGDLQDAKVIDFGIAKDLDPSNKTIVGDGFAGKLGYVAPEQFGDFDREIGPWTDIYSLALVILSVAAGRPIDMGATLVDAIDKRRKGPDLTPLPEHLRPVFAKMLAANPAERYRSMAEVLAALDLVAAGKPLPAGGGTAAPGAPASGAAKPAKKGGVSPVMIAAGVGALVVVGGAAAFFLRPKPETPAGAAPPGATAAAGGGSELRQAELARRAVEAALPNIGCTWLDIDDASEGTRGVNLRLSGVAADPAAAQQAVASAARSSGAQIGVLDTSAVFPVSNAACPALDGFRTIRVPTSDQGRRFMTEQSNWELRNDNPPCQGPNAKPIVNMQVGDRSRNFTIVGMDRAGKMQQIFPDRAAFDAYRQGFPDQIQETGDDGYRLTTCFNETGLVGQLLITGAAPFAVDLPPADNPDSGRVVDAAWVQRFKSLAAQKGWKAEMVWYRVVDDTPG